jgi:uncharacterized membrane protein YedE/YeeE
VLLMWTSIYLFFVSPLLKWLGLSGLIGAVGIAIYLLAPRTPPWFPIDLNRFRKVALAVGIGAFVVGGFFWYAFHQGESHMAQRIAAKDRDAERRVERALIDVEACNGGVNWNVTTGSCNR